MGKTREKYLSVRVDEEASTIHSRARLPTRSRSTSTSMRETTAAVHSL